MKTKWQGSEKGIRIWNTPRGGGGQVDEGFAKLKAEKCVVVINKITRNHSRDRSSNTQQIWQLATITAAAVVATTTTGCRRGLLLCYLLHAPAIWALNKKAHHLTPRLLNVAERDRARQSESGNCCCSLQGVACHKMLQPSRRATCEQFVERRHCYLTQPWPRGWPAEGREYHEARL